MEVFNYCWITLLGEAKKCSVFFDKNTCKVKDNYDENFEKPLNRVSYLYKFGSFNILFFQKCFNEFITNAPGALAIVDRICVTRNLNVCSLSTGPGTDIIGFLYSLHHLHKPLADEVNFRVISKHGAWRNLVHEMLSSETTSVPNSSNCKLIQCDFLSKLSAKAESYLKNADVLLMCKSFSSPKATKSVICKVLKNIVQLLKPGAVVFFISSEQKLAYFNDVTGFGTFLYGPKEIRLDNLPYDQKVVEVVEVKPMCSDSAFFAVWQKSVSKISEIGLNNEVKTSDVTLNSDQIKLGDLSSNSACTKETPVFEKKTKLKFDAGKLTQGTSSSSKLSCPTAIMLTNSKPPIVKTNTIGIKEENTDKVAKDSIIADSSPYRCKSSTPTKVTTSTNTKSCFSIPENLTKVPVEDAMTSRLEHLEDLVSNLEGLVRTQRAFGHSPMSNDTACSQNVCSCNPNAYQNIPHCCPSTNSPHMHPSTIQNCQQCPMHSQVHNSCNYISQNCNASKCQDSSYLSSPHIVIPTETLTERSLSQILSVLSQMEKN